MAMSTDTRLALLEDAYKRQERWGEGIENTLGEISRSIAMIAETSRLAEARHSDHRETVSRIFAELAEANGRINAHDERMREIETNMPGLKEVRRWVIAGVLAVVMAAASVVWSSAVDAPVHMEPGKGA
jgi:chromosome segregation ATPase